MPRERSEPAHPPALSAAALPAGHHDARTQGGHHGYEEGSYIGSVNIAGSIYKQFGNSDFNEEHDNWASSGAKWCRTYKLTPGDAFLFSALDDHLAAHRVCRHIEAKVAKRISATQKRRWRTHSRLPDTPAEEDRVVIVFRRMPKGETAFFDAAGKRKE